MCSSTVTPVVAGCTRWNLAEKDTGRASPAMSVDVRRIGGGKPEMLWLRVRRGCVGSGGIDAIDACGEMCGACACAW